MYIAIFSGCLATLLWALFPAFCKVALEHVNAYEFLLLRYIVAFSLLVYLMPRVIKKFSRMSLISWIMVFLMISVHNTSQALCLSDVPVSWYILFFSCSPILTYMMIKGKKHPFIYGCFGSAILGTIIFINPNNVHSMPSFLSLFCLFLSITSWSALTLIISNFHKVYDDLEIAYILNASNLITATTLFVFFNPKSIYDLHIANAWIPILIIGITSPLAVILFSKSIRMFPLFGIASQYMELVFGIVIGYFLFQEIPTYYQYIGAFFIILALVGTTIYSSHETGSA